jgi:hypothetical protein
MHAAIVELDALADAVRPAAEDDDAGLVGAGAHFVFVFVGGIVVGRVGLKLRRAGVHQPVARGSRPAACAAFAIFSGALHLKMRAQLHVGKSHALGVAQVLGVDSSSGWPSSRGTAPRTPRISLHVVQEPRVDAGTGADFLARWRPGAGPRRILQHAAPRRANRLQECSSQFRRRRALESACVVAVKSAAEDPWRPISRRAQGLLQRFLEGAANAHGLAHDFICTVSRAVGAGELLKGPARNLGRLRSRCWARSSRAFPW